MCSEGAEDVVMDIYELQQIVAGRKEGQPIVIMSILVTAPPRHQNPSHNDRYIGLGLVL